MKPKFERIEIEGRKQQNDPFTTAFVYASNNHYFIVGYRTEVRNFITSKFDKCLYHLTYWKNKHPRGCWMIHFKNEMYKGYVVPLVESLPINPHPLKKTNNHKKYRMTIWKNGELISETLLRKIPNKFPTEFLSL